METIRRFEIEPIIRRVQSNNPTDWTFGVRFTKKDGSDRVMSCRFGVTSRLKGGTRSWSRADYANLICVFDMNAKDQDGKKGAYRTINLDTIYQVNIDHKVFEVID